MAFIPLPNGIRVGVEYTLSGETVVNVYHVTRTAPVVTANLTALAEIFLEWWDEDDTVGAKDSFSNDLALFRVVATDVSELGGEQVINVPVTPIPGASSTDSAPNNVAWCVGLRTGLVGRSYMGRNYYCGFSDVAWAGNILDAGIAAAHLDHLSNLQVSLAAEGFTWVVASYQNLGLPRTTAVGSEITSFQADTIADSQRRRLPGR